jgi:hypothetical protein
MNYFAYGPNLNKKQMLERCPDSKPMFIATLPNYKLIFAGWSRQWRGGVISIKPFRGERVPNYNRLNITVFDEDGEPIEAMTYIKSQQPEETAPSREYLSVIQQGYRDWRIV